MDQYNAIKHLCKAAPSSYNFREKLWFFSNIFKFFIKIWCVMRKVTAVEQLLGCKWAIDGTLCLCHALYEDQSAILVPFILPSASYLKFVNFFFFWIELSIKKKMCKKLFFMKSDGKIYNKSTRKLFQLLWSNSLKLKVWWGWDCYWTTELNLR